MTIRGSRPHFRAVGRQPGDLKARVKSSFGEHLAQEQNTLAAEAGDAYAKINLCVERGASCKIRRRQSFFAEGKETGDCCQWGARPGRNART